MVVRFWGWVNLIGGGAVCEWGFLWHFGAVSLSFHEGFSLSVRRILCSVSLLCLAACQPDPPPATPLPPLSSFNAASQADTAFAQTVNEADVLDVAASRVVVAFGCSPAVRAFAAEVIGDHQANHTALQQVAHDDALTVSDTLPPQDLSLLKRLDRERGAVLDARYVRIIRATNEALLPQLDQEAKESVMPDLRNFASSMALMERAHAERLSGLSMRCGRG